MRVANNRIGDKNKVEITKALKLEANRRAPLEAKATDDVTVRRHIASEQSPLSRRTLLNNNNAPWC